MKKIYILLFLLMFSSNAYSFWIWTPKDKKWENSKSGGLATPYLKYKESLKHFDKGNYKDAYKGLKYFIKRYPDAKEAAEAQYFLGECLEKLDKHYDAFLAYQKLIESYPNSQRINDAIKRQYDIGEYFLNIDPKKMLGMSIYDFVEQPAIDIFKKIVETVPFSEYASRAQYKLGVVLTNIGRYEPAREAFQKVIDVYSDTEFATPAKYQLALVTAKSFTGSDYDSSNLEDAAERLDEFINNNPEAQVTSEAEDQLKNLRNIEAKKTFDIGDFYEKQDKYQAAINYYKKVIKKYPESLYYKISEQRIDDLEALVKANLTKKELERKNKQDRKLGKKRKKKELLKEEQLKTITKASERKAEELRINKEKIRKEKISEELNNKKVIKSPQDSGYLINEKIDKNAELNVEKERNNEEKLDIIRKRLKLIEENLDETVKNRDIQYEDKGNQKIKKSQEIKEDKLRLKQEKIAKVKKGREEKVEKINDIKAEKIRLKQEKIAKAKKVREEKVEKINNIKAEKIRLKQEKIAKAKKAKEEKLEKIRVMKAEKLRIKRDKIEKKEFQKYNRNNTRIDVIEMEQSLKDYNESRAK